jgi:hypothetical protein
MDERLKEGSESTRAKETCAVASQLVHFYSEEFDMLWHYF